MRFISYAQNFEDVMLRRALQGVENGFYIDVGAAHPVEMSVTKAFYDTGWRGINLEPALHYFGLLQDERPRDINLQLAAAARRGHQIFHEIAATGLSTLDADIANGHAAAGWAVETREIQLTTLADICRRHAPGEIHFLKIDVEGAEGAVLSGADFKTFRPWIVLIEATRPLTMIVADEWEASILAADYIFVWFDGLNRFYVSDERHAELKDYFRLPPNSFDHFVMYDAELSDRVMRLTVDVEEARTSLRDNENSIALLEAEVLLRRRMQETAAHEAAHHAREADFRAHDAALQAYEANLRIASYSADIETLHAEKRAMQGRAETLDRLFHTLRSPTAPRALRVVLPLAQIIRKICGVRGLRKSLRPALQLTRIIRVSLRGRSMIHPTPPRENHALPMRMEEPEICGAVSKLTAPVKKSRHAVHQFHPGCAFGDAVTNSMLLTREILRNLGYRSDIYVVHRDPMLAHEILLLDELPMHDEYVLIVLHSLGYDDADRITALSAPKILMYHNITPAHLLADMPDLARLAELGRRQLDLWRPHMAATLAVSEFNALELRQHAYIDVAICPLLFDIDRLRARAIAARPRDPADPFTILFVGRILESKGQAELVDAFGAFNLAYGRDCRLVLVGRTEGGGDQYLAKLYQRIGEQGLRRCVILTGHVSDAELSDWLKGADLYVSLSQHEGFGVPLIEAMAFGVPVLAYAAGAVPFTMHNAGASGQILYSRDAKTVAARMLQIAQHPARRADIIARQNENLERFALPYHIPTLEKALAVAGASPVHQKNANALADGLVFTIAGHFNSSYSLASVNCALATALVHECPDRVKILPVEGNPTLFLDNVPASRRALMQCLAAVDLPSYAPSVVISQHYPVYVPSPADLMIAYFFWEESLIPKETVCLLNEHFHAVFSPSNFVTKTLIDSGVRLPVRTIGYVPELKKHATLGTNRTARAGDQKVTFLHVSSAFPRKGVDILLAAYARRFTSQCPVRLVIKTVSNPHNETVQQIARLRSRYDDLAEIELIEQDLDEAEMLALYADADIAVLPTRGEGFNVPAAEAMAAGLAVIVTGAGGQSDFVSEQTAFLIPWTMQPSRSHLGSSLSLWLAPDEDALAATMHDVFLDMQSGGGKAARRVAYGRQAAARGFDPAAWVRRTALTAARLMSKPVVQVLRLTVISSWNVRCGIAEYSRNLLSHFSAISNVSDTMLLLCDDRTPAADTSGLRVRPAWALGTADTAALWAAIGQEDPHVLMIQHHPGLISWSSLAGLLRDTRLAQRVVVVTLHSTLELLRGPGTETDGVLVALRGCDRVIVHTLADVNFLHGLGLWANVVMIPQGAIVPGDWPAPRPMSVDIAPIIGCYGFFLPPKGIDLLVSAIPAIQKKCGNIRLRLLNAFYGTEESAAEIEKCQALARGLGVEDCIEWMTDFLPHDESIQLLAGCDLIVLPYRPTRESSSAALRSCLSSGIPVIVAPNAIFDEAADAVARLSGDTPEMIAESVLALLENRSARAALQSAMRLWLEERCWDDIGRRTQGMLMGLVEARSTDESEMSQAGDIAIHLEEHSQCNL